jgi:hypothetical protein
MTITFYDRVQETTTTTGSGTLTLAGAVAGFQSFACVGNGNQTHYCITDNGSNYEVGLGTYTLSGTTLSRTTILASSNGGSAVTFGSGTKYVFQPCPATIINSFIAGLLPSQTGESGNYLTTNGTTASWSAISSGGSPGGSNTDVQTNNGSGGFAGSANLTWDGVHLTINAGSNTTGGVILNGTVYPCVTLENSGSVIGYSPIIVTGTGGFFANALINDMGFRTNSNRILFGQGTGNATMIVENNVALFNTGSYGGGIGVVFIANSTTTPTSNPSGGGILYASGGALYWLGSSGTSTKIANA